MKPKEFMNRWKQGIMEVTPEQRLKSDMFSLLFILIGCFGGSIALAILLFVTFSLWQLFLVILLFFSGVMNISAFIEKYQQHQTFKNIRSENFGLNQETLEQYKEEDNFPMEMLGVVEDE